MSLGSFKSTRRQVPSLSHFDVRYIFRSHRAKCEEKEKHAKAFPKHKACLSVGWRVGLCTQGCNNRGEKECMARISRKECAARSPRSFNADVRSVSFGHLAHCFPPLMEWSSKSRMWGNLGDCSFDRFLFSLTFQH